MSISPEAVRHIVDDLRSGDKQVQVKAAMELRNLAEVVQNKEAIRKGDGIHVLLQLLDSGHHNVLTTVCAETIACLAAGDLGIREAIRNADGVKKLVGLMSAGPGADCTHRALLALRVLTSDCEADRLAILKAGGVEQLVKLLAPGPDSEITEYAAAALGNLAAGGPALKDAIREAGGIWPLVRLLKDSQQATAAELAAVALRNMALQNELNKEAIKAAGGLEPLLSLLSSGQYLLTRPLQCEVVYKDLRNGKGQAQFAASQCSFDTRRVELCLASASTEGSIFGCLARQAKQRGPFDKSAERYTLHCKMTMSEPNETTLELVFTVANQAGAPRVVEAGQQPPSKWLQRVIISPCPAAEMRGALMRLLTRTSLEKEFKLGKHAKAVDVSTGGSAKTDVRVPVLASSHFA